MALAITTGTNDHSFNCDGLPHPRAVQMVSIFGGAAVSLKFLDGTSMTVVKAETTVDATPFTSASTINDFYDAMAAVCLVPRIRAPSAVDVIALGADPSGVADATTAIRNAITAALAGSRTLTGHGTFLISEPIDVTGLTDVTLGVLKKATVFTGDELAFVTNVGAGIDFPLRYARLVFDGVNRSVNGFRADGQTVGQNEIHVYGTLCDTLLDCANNTEKSLFFVHGYACNRIVDDHANGDLSFTPDENVFHIFGATCDQAYRQQGSTSSTVHLAVEQTGNGSYAVEILGQGKTVTLLGEIRAANSGGVLIDGGTSLTVNMNNLVLLATAGGLVVDAQGCLSITGSISAVTATAGGLYIGDVNNGFFTAALAAISGGTVVQLGTVSGDRCDRVKVSLAITDISGSQIPVYIANCYACHVEVASLNGGTGAVTIHTRTYTQLTLPTQFLGDNRGVTREASDTAEIRFVGGGVTTSQITAYSTPLFGMVVFDRTLGVWATYNNGWKRASTELLTAGVSADMGDAAYALVASTSPKVLRWGTPLTANRNLNAPASSTFNNNPTFRVLREASATGAFNLTVNTTLVVLGPGEWADILYTGSAWILTAGGALP
jgi:hypothetical protein